MNSVDQYITEDEVHLICNLTLDPVAAIDAHLHDIFHLSPLQLVRFPNPLVKRGPCLIAPPPSSSIHVPSYI